MEVNPLQPEKAQSPIEVTPEGIVMLVNPLQPQKTQSSVLVTLEGMVKLVKPLHISYLQLVVYQFVLIKTVEK